MVNKNKVKEAAKEKVKENFEFLKNISIHDFKRPQLLRIFLSNKISLRGCLGNDKLRTKYSYKGKVYETWIKSDYKRETEKMKNNNQ